MDIVIRTGTQTASLRTNKYESVINIKHILSNHYKIPLDKMRITNKNCLVLKDSHTLKYYEIVDKDTINMCTLPTTNLIVSTNIRPGIPIYDNHVFTITLSGTVRDMDMQARAIITYTQKNSGLTADNTTVYNNTTKTITCTLKKQLPHGCTGSITVIGQVCVTGSTGSGNLVILEHTAPFTVVNSSPIRLYVTLEQGLENKVGKMMVFSYYEKPLETLKKMVGDKLGCLINDIYVNSGTVMVGVSDDNDVLYLKDGDLVVGVEVVPEVSDVTAEIIEKICVVKIV